MFFVVVVVVVVVVKEKFYQGKKMCFTLSPVSRNLIFAPLFKRNISRSKMREKLIISRNHLFAQRLCAKIRCARKFSELRYSTLFSFTMGP